MSNSTGVYETTKKDGSIYYRVSITYKNKHISLGSFDDKDTAKNVYKEAYELINSDIDEELSEPGILYPPDSNLSFEKWIILLNFKNNNLYFKTPIYLQKKFFLYYLNSKRCLKFDVDDLFYYSTHKIMARGNHLFVNDYGMQVSILSRYNIKSYAVCGRDYIFTNGDCDDFRYGNIEIINKYYGVLQCKTKNTTKYKAVIHINGNYNIGTYENETIAAIAYNKAVDILNKNGLKKNYPLNYIDDISQIEYAKLYNSIRISPKIRNM